MGLKYIFLGLHCVDVFELALFSPWQPVVYFVAPMTSCLLRREENFHLKGTIPVHAVLCPILSPLENIQNAE